MPTLLFAIPFVSKEHSDWLLHDPTGQKAGLAVALVVGLIALVIIFKSMRWAAARANVLIILAIVAAALYYGSVVLFNLGPVGWIVAAVVAFGTFMGLALFLTVARR